ncbi:MAG: serine/threonine-protein kinase, partial [Enhygromyxa sp.]
MSPTDDDDLDKDVEDYTFDELVEIGGLSDEEFAQRFQAEPISKPRPKELPPDLDELFTDVRNVAISRRILATLGDSPEAIPGHPFDRFEAFGGNTGGMGLVLEARDPVLDRTVAIKLWKQSGPKAQQALLDEARMLARLTHPNVVTVHDTGRWGERVFFVMEWIDGVDGHVWLATSRSWREVRDVFVDAGRGLAAAHQAGIQHRDFKPDNMLVGNDGRTVVADFGIAESLRSVENTDPRWGTPAGTPEYMAPERLRGEPGDARSDQFSFCVALWRGLYGLRPFAGAGPDELLEAVERGEVRTAPGADVPQWLAQVVRKGLAAEPDDRYSDMHELIAALLDEPPDEAADEGEVDDDDVPLVDGRVLHKPPVVGSRPIFVVALSLVCGVVLGGVGYLAAVKQSRERPDSEHEIAPLPAPPCTLDHTSDPNDVDLVVIEVCRLIRIDHYQAADMLWEREHAGRLSEARATATGGRPMSMLGADSLIIARTFIEQAEELERTDPKKARMAARHALHWARQAGVDLGTPQ